MSNQYSETVDTARTYYNSSDADRFYFTIWGGEDIHIGLYQGPDDSIFDASRRTVEKLAEQFEGLDSSSRVLDLGAGYGGAARYLVEKYDCAYVECLNLSEVQNERDRELNAKNPKFAERIKVTDGSFEAIPSPDASFDALWSQDAFLHSGNRKLVLEEADRVLKSGGRLVFTDPMQSDDCPDGVLQPILDRIHLDSLGSPAFYRAAAKELGWKEVRFLEMTEQLVNHYSRVHNEIDRRFDEISKAVSPEYLERMKKGLMHWVNGGKAGHLAWGIFVFEKP